MKKIIADFHARELPLAITKRDLSIPLDTGKIITVIGPRRTGKTWYLYSLIKELRKSHPPQKIVYINFEDERLELQRKDLQLILDAYQQLYPAHNLSEVYFFFDEIQEIDGWDTFVRRVHESISTRIVVTGSSSKLLSGEIASSLRGRSIAYLLLPFSFAEYLRHRAVSVDDVTSSKSTNSIISYFHEYLQQGGYPEAIGYNHDLFIKTIQSYVDIMLYRDIIERYDVTNVHLVKDLMKRLIATNAKVFSVNKYYNDARSRGLHVSKDTIYNLMVYFEDAFSILPVLKYHDSPVKQEQALKKMYVNDTGIATAYNVSGSADTGQLLETFVLLEMKKKGIPAFYYANGFETDFVVQGETNIREALQVCLTLDDENCSREKKALIKAMERFDLTEGYILTEVQEEEQTLDGRTIRVLPAWKWALGR